MLNIGAKASILQDHSGGNLFLVLMYIPQSIAMVTTMQVN